MNRVTSSLICLFFLINIVQCKKYLVEVEDKKGSNAKDNRDLWRKEDNATIEPEGITPFPSVLFIMKINSINQLVR